MKDHSAGREELDDLLKAAPASPAAQDAEEIPRPLSQEKVLS